MDHKQAIGIKAAERYVLGDFPERVRHAFEAHFFDCVECQKHLRVLLTFSENARAVFLEHPENFRQGRLADTQEQASAGLGISKQRALSKRC